MKNALAYLSALKENNNRDWYHANKDWYQKANMEFEELVGELMTAIAVFDPKVMRFAPHDLIFKLQRDTRFSHDKAPYNPKFRAHISIGGKLPIPCGYYLVIAQDDQSFLGGGLFASMFSGATTRIRDYLVSHDEAFLSIITEPYFKSHFKIEGEILKTVPRGYDKEHPQAEYLKYKSWYLQNFLTDDQVSDCNFTEEAAILFQGMKPFNDYLNQALQGFQMPSH
ncbi:MAG: DUF2461 domain-containing protein [Erysipelotrichaceae bacterium]|jgi:uncharacterized protein (TIGR02453 family)|nr:DUF2461 domain-containing protein [Erysipelotrichaceae bacterium]